MSLHGFRPVDPAAPVTHVSYYEADAFARWAGYRLPTEFEWEVAAASVPVEGRMLGNGHVRAMPAKGGSGLQQMFGDVWEWTGSAYLPYPGFKAAPGAVGEYNGKFMCNQFVLRGGSCVTPDGHVRRDLSQFLLSPSALAVHRPAPGRRGVMEGDVSLQLPQGSPAPAAEHARAADDRSREFADAVLSGFAQSQRSIPCRFFYDAVGSELFEEIVKLDEYYPTRVEAALLEAHRAEIAGARRAMRAC